MVIAKERSGCRMSIVDIGAENAVS